MNVFDLQFWVICLIVLIVIFGVALWFKKIVINAISKSIAEVVRDQWAAMFKQLDSYKLNIEKIELEIKVLREKHSWLEDKALLNRKDIEKIMREIRKQDDN